MVDVFVSYKREERPRIAPLVEQIRTGGLDVWIDAKARVSASFIVEINRALEGCSCAVVFWSRASITSNWVLSESYVAYEQEKLIPVLLDNVAVPAPFNLLQAVDFTRWSGSYKAQEWLALVEAITAYARPPKITPARPSARKAPHQEPRIAEHFPSGRTFDGVLTANKRTREQLKKKMLQCVIDGGGAIPSAKLAQQLRREFHEIHNFDWFGAPTLRELFNALKIEELIFESAPPGIVRIKRSEAQVLVERQKSHEAMVSEVFELTEAPLLGEHEFKAVFHAIAKSIAEGAKGRSSIAKRSRELLADLGMNVSRVKIDYIITGAIFGGIDIANEHVAGRDIGRAFAKTLIRQCGAHGWFVDNIAANVVLSVLGIGDMVSVDEIKD